MITRNMALRMAVFIVCLSIIFPLCACEPHGYSGADMDLYSVTHNSFPMTDYYETITPMDTDAYGRVLFEYRTSMALFYDTEDGFVYAYMVMQRSDEDTCSYYNLECCMLSKSQLSGNEENLASLKEKNDWGKPLQEALITTSPVKKKYLSIDESELDKIARMMGIRDKYQCGSFSSDPLGGEVILFREYDDADGLVYHDAYAAILPYGYAGEAVQYVKLVDIYNYPEELAVWLRKH